MVHGRSSRGGVWGGGLPLPSFGGPECYPGKLLEEYRRKSVQFWEHQVIKSGTENRRFSVKSGMEFTVPVVLGSAAPVFWESHL